MKNLLEKKTVVFFDTERMDLRSGQKSPKKLGNMLHAPHLSLIINNPGVCKCIGKVQ